MLGTEDTEVDTALWWRNQQPQDLSRLEFKDRGILDCKAPSNLSGSLSGIVSQLPIHPDLRDYLQASWKQHSVGRG